MLKEIYNKLFEETERMVDWLRKSQEHFFRLSDREAKLEFAALLQETAIQWGECLEKYGLDNSEIITLLEKYCENVYVFITEENNKHIASELENNLKMIIPALCASVKVTEYVLSITAIVKNEADYILEWLEYHRMVGITHFYIYDNDSTDHLYEKLKGYIDRRIVTYIRWTGEAQQLRAYNDALNNYKYDTKYMAFIDIDEFLVPILDKNLPDIVDEIFNEIDYVGGIGVNWRVYGSSFHDTKMPGLIIENYKYRSEDFERAGANFHIKTICDPRRMSRMVNPHYGKYLEGFYCTSENGSIIFGPFFYDGMCRKLRINHYVIKSKEEYIKRQLKGKADHVVVYTEEEIESQYNNELEILNRVYDPIMDQYTQELGRRIELASKGIIPEGGIDFTLKSATDMLKTLIIKGQSHLAT